MSTPVGVRQPNDQVQVLLVLMCGQCDVLVKSDNRFKKIYKHVSGGRTPIKIIYINITLNNIF